MWRRLQNARKIRVQWPDRFDFDDGGVVGEEWLEVTGSQVATECSQFVRHFCHAYLEASSVQESGRYVDHRRTTMTRFNELNEKFVEFFHRGNKFREQGPQDPEACVPPQNCVAVVNNIGRAKIR